MDRMVFGCFGYLHGDAIDMSTIWCSQQTKQPYHSFQRVQRIKLLSTQESRSLYFILGSLGFVFCLFCHTSFGLFTSSSRTLSLALSHQRFFSIVLVPFKIYFQIIWSVWVPKRLRIIQTAMNDLDLSLFDFFFSLIFLRFSVVWVIVNDCLYNYRYCNNQCIHHFAFLIHIFWIQFEHCISVL